MNILIILISWQCYDHNQVWYNKMYHNFSFFHHHSYSIADCFIQIVATRLKSNLALTTVFSAIVSALNCVKWINKNIITASNRIGVIWTYREWNGQRVKQLESNLLVYSGFCNTQQRPIGNHPLTFHFRHNGSNDLLYFVKASKELTHWGLDKMSTISRRYFQMHFLEWKSMSFA